MALQPSATLEQTLSVEQRGRTCRSVAASMPRLASKPEATVRTVSSSIAPTPRGATHSASPAPLPDQAPHQISGDVDYTHPADAHIRVQNLPRLSLAAVHCMRDPM